MTEVVDGDHSNGDDNKVSSMAEAVDGDPSNGDYNKVSSMAEAVDGDHSNGDSKVSSITGLGLSDQLIDPWCDQCYDETDQKVSADGFCNECNNFLCKSCIDGHRKVPLLRNHKVTKGAKMPESQAEKPVRYLDCDKHYGQDKDSYCFNHGSMLCNLCIKDSHKYCKTNAISLLCKNTETADFQKLTDTIENFRINVVPTQLLLQDNINDIDAKKKEMIKEVEMIRDNLIKDIHSLCSDTVSKIKEVCQQKSVDINHTISLFADMIHSLEGMVRDIRKISLHAYFGPNQFIQLQDTIMKSRLYKILIEEQQEHLNIIHLSLTPSTVISEFISKCKQLGNVNEVSFEVDTFTETPEITFPALDRTGRITPTKTQHSDIMKTNATQMIYFTCKMPDLRLGNISEVDTFVETREAYLPSLITKRMRTPTRARQSDIMKINITQTMLLNSRIPTDTSCCAIWGMDVTKNGILLLADSNNKCVKIFSPDSKSLTSLSLPGVPLDITAIDEKTAASCTYDNALHILDISKPTSPSVKRSMSLLYKADVVVSCNDNLVITSWSEPKRVKMIDLKGREIWSASTGHKRRPLFTYPPSITTAVLASKEVILVTDIIRDILTVLDANNGKLIRATTLVGKLPRGLSTDTDGNIYVGFYNTRELCICSADLSKCRVILSADDLKGAIGAITYNRNTDELFVTYCGTDLIDCFHLS